MKKILIALVLALTMITSVATPASAAWNSQTVGFASCTSGDVKAITAIRTDTDLSGTGKVYIQGAIGYALGSIGSADRTNFSVTISTPWYVQTGRFQSPGKYQRGVDMRIPAKRGQTVRIATNVHFDLYWQSDRRCSMVRYVTV